MPLGVFIYINMASQNELIYDIKEYLKAYSDDVELSDRHILYMYRKKRAKYLRRLLNDYTRKFDDLIIQSLCMELECVDRATCGLELGCTIVRTVKPLPTLLELRSRDTLLSVGPTMVGGETFKIIKLSEVPYILEKPFSRGIYAFLNTDGHIYLISNNDAHILLECITVTGLFEDPDALADFTNCCKGDCGDDPTPCFSGDEEYPLQSFLIDDISNEIKKELMARMRLTEDPENNATDDQ